MVFEHVVTSKKGAVVGTQLHIKVGILVGTVGGLKA